MTNVLKLLQNYLDVNVGDYTYFSAEYWYEKFKNHYSYLEFDDFELDEIFEYLEKIEMELMNN